MLSGEAAKPPSACQYSNPGYFGESVAKRYSPSYVQPELDQVGSELEAVRLQLSQIQAGDIGGMNRDQGGREAGLLSYEQRSQDRTAAQADRRPTLSHAEQLVAL